MVADQASDDDRRLTKVLIDWPINPIFSPSHLAHFWATGVFVFTRVCVHAVRRWMENDCSPSTVSRFRLMCSMTLINLELIRYLKQRVSFGDLEYSSFNLMFQNHYCSSFIQVHVERKYHFVSIPVRHHFASFFNRPLLNPPSCRRPRCRGSKKRLILCIYCVWKYCWQ